MTKNDMELLYDKYSGSVYRLAVSYCKNTADAEDIVQEVFMKLFSADMDFPDERSEKAWKLQQQLPLLQRSLRRFIQKRV